jgi:hypothetical protein
VEDEVPDVPAPPVPPHAARLTSNSSKAAIRLHTILPCIRIASHK